MYILPNLEYKALKNEFISIIVPKVDLELPPILLWSIIIGVDKLSIWSALTSPYLGKKFLIKALNVSFNWRCASFATVSKTIEDLP